MEVVPHLHHSFSFTLTHCCHHSSNFNTFTPIVQWRRDQVQKQLIFKKMKKGVLFWVLSVIVAATVCSHCSLALTQDGKPNPQFISFAHFGLKLSSFSSADDDKLSCSSHSCILLSWVFDFDVLHIKIVSLLCLDILFWVFFEFQIWGFVYYFSY